MIFRFVGFSWEKAIVGHDRPKWGRKKSIYQGVTEHTEAIKYISRKNAGKLDHPPSARRMPRKEKSVWPFDKITIK
jgi:hypothetical protein